MSSVIYCLFLSVFSVKPERVRLALFWSYLGHTLICSPLFIHALRQEVSDNQLISPNHRLHQVLLSQNLALL